MNGILPRCLIALLLCTGLSGARQARNRPEQGAGPRLGETAPDFKLKALEKDPRGADIEVTLSQFKGKKPVLLILGSYT